MTVAQQQEQLSPRHVLATRLGRSDRSALGRWFWEINRVLLLLVLTIKPAGLFGKTAIKKV